MSFYEWNKNNPLKINKFGIPEPIKIKKKVIPESISFHQCLMYSYQVTRIKDNETIDLGPEI